MKMSDTNTPSSSIDHVIMWPTLLVLAAICAFLMTNIEEGTKVIQSILTWCEYKLGWAYLLCIIGTTFFSLWLAFGRYNKVQLCAPGEKAQFSVLRGFYNCVRLLLKLQKGLKTRLNWLFDR